MVGLQNTIESFVNSFLGFFTSLMETVFGSLTGFFNGIGF